MQILVEKNLNSAEIMDNPKGWSLGEVGISNLKKANGSDSKLQWVH